MKITPRAEAICDMYPKPVVLKRRIRWKITELKLIELEIDEAEISSAIGFNLQTIP